MQRPCAFTAVALIAGIVTSRYIPVHFLLPVLFAVVLLLLLVLLKPKGYLRPALLLAILALAGAAYSLARAAPPEHSDVANLLQKPVRNAVLTGCVSTFPVAVPSSSSEAMYRFDMHLCALAFGGKSRPATGTVRVYLSKFKTPPGIEPRDTITLNASLYPVAHPTNPAQVDYSMYYKRLGISARAYLSNPDNLKLIDKGAVSWPRRALHAARKRILDALGSAFENADGDKGRLLGALLLGERASLGEDIEDLYRKTGTVHFLALSGLHVAIFGFFLWYTLALLPLGRRIRVILVMAGLVLYCLIGGASISLVRATAMGLLYLGAELLWRQRDSLNITGAAAILIILIDPADIFSLGFQLSFIAVLSIIALGPLYGQLRSGRSQLILRLQQPEEMTRLDRLRASVTDSFLVWGTVSFSAWLGVAPLIAYHFNTVTPISLLLNVIISPAIWALLVLGILLCVCALVSLPIACLLAFVVSFLIGGITKLLEVFSSQPFHFYIPNSFLAPFSISWVVLYYALLIGIALRLRNKGLQWRQLATAGLLLTGAYLLVPWQVQTAAQTRLTALDVGSGNTFVIRTADGATVLYDCGGGNKEVGRNIIAPYLWHQGVTTIDAIILSHPDIDHTCALSDIVQRFEVGAVIVSDLFERNDEGRNTLKPARDHGVEIKTVAPGQKVEIGGARFEVLAPLASEMFGKPLSDNDTSLIVRMFDKGALCLFTGDAEAALTALLLDSGADVRCDILMVPHHGGENLLIASLASKSQARFAIISSSREQPPAADALEQVGVQILSTLESGAITLHHKDGKYTVEEFLRD